MVGLESSSRFSGSYHKRLQISDLSGRLKWYYENKIISFFLQILKACSLEFYPKSVYFECHFWISRSAETHIQN